MTAPPYSTAVLRSLLDAWAQIVREHIFPAEVIPWWLDCDALMQSITLAAERLGWQVRTRFESADPGDEWDMRITTPETGIVIRCVCAGVNIEPGAERWSVVEDTWRVLSLTSPAPSNTIGVHLVAVMPLISHAGDEDAVRSAAIKWLAAHAMRGEDGMSVWVDAATPMPRNSAGSAFPGLGLIARAGRWP